MDIDALLCPICIHLNIVYVNDTELHIFISVQNLKSSFYVFNAKCTEHCSIVYLFADINKLKNRKN